MPFFGTGGAARDLAYSNSVDGMANAIARSSFKIFEGEKKVEQRRPKKFSFTNHLLLGDLTKSTCSFLLSKGSNSS